MKKSLDYLHRITEKNLIMCRIHTCHANIHHLANVLSLRTVSNETLSLDNSP